MGLSYDQLFPGRFIKAGAFDGKPVTLTIKDVYMDNLEDESGIEQARPIVSFQKTKREWALNKTNAQCLVAMWGQDSGDWIGKRVTLFPERDASGLSDSGLCIRVKGSPDLKKALTATVKLPRRKPITRQLVPTGSAPIEHTEESDPFNESDDRQAACVACGRLVSLTQDVTDADLSEIVCEDCGGGLTWA